MKRVAGIWQRSRAVVAAENPLREEMLVLALAVPAAMFVGISFERRLQLILVIALALGIELIQAAVANLADDMVTEADPFAARLRKAGSVAVLFALVIAALVWLFAIAERLFGL